MVDISDGGNSSASDGDGGSSTGSNPEPLNDDLPADEAEVEAAVTDFPEKVVDISDSDNDVASGTDGDSGSVVEIIDDDDSVVIIEWSWCHSWVIFLLTFRIAKCSELSWCTELVLIFWYWYSGTDILVLIFWYWYSGTDILVLIFWYRYSGAGMIIVE